MSLVYLAILLEAERRERMMAAAHRKKQTTKKKEAESPMPYLPRLKDVIKQDYRLINCMFSFLDENPEALSSFKKLIENANALYKEDLEKTDAEITSLIPQSTEIVQSYNEAYQRLSGLGLTVELEQDGRFLFVTQPSNPTSSKHSYDTIPMPVSINGIALTAEMVQSDASPYIERLQMFNAEYPDCEDEFLQAQTELDNLKSHKIRLKFSKAEQQHLQSLEEKLAELQPLIEQKHQFESDAEVYASLTESQKEILLDYLKKQQAMRELSDTVTKLRNTSLFKLGYTGFAAEEDYKSYVNGFVSTAMEKLSPEDSQNIDKLFNDVIVFLLSSTPDELAKRTRFSKRVIEDDNMMKKCALSELSGYITQQIEETLAQAEQEAQKSKQY